MKTLGDVLKKRRKELGITQAQAAEDYFGGVDRQAFSVWERGARATLDGDFLAQLADFLGTNNEGALRAIGWLGDDDGRDATVRGDSGAYLNRRTAAFTSVTDINARRKVRDDRRRAMAKPA